MLHLELQKLAHAAFFHLNGKSSFSFYFSGKKRRAKSCGLASLLALWFSFVTANTIHYPLNRWPMYVTPPSLPYHLLG